jgi:hypothetical protein
MVGRPTFLDTTSTDLAGGTQMTANEVALSHLGPDNDPAPGMARDRTTFNNITPRQFAGALADMTEPELDELFHALEDDLRHGKAGSSTRRDLDEVVWELQRRETDRRTRERRQANIVASRKADAVSIDGEPGVWVHGRPLDDRERGDLAVFIRWAMATGRRSHE